MAGATPYPLGRLIPPDFRHVARFPLSLAAPPAFTVEKDLDLQLGVWSLAQADQGNKSACVGFGCTRLSTIDNRKRYDPWWLWRAAKGLDPWPNPDSDRGTLVSSAMDALRTLGHVVVVDGEDLPVNLCEGIDRNEWATRVDDLRLCIYHDLPSAIGIEWPNSFFSPTLHNGERWIGRGNLGSADGGHCVCIYGASDERQAFHVVNNWGAQWPPVWLPYETMQWLLDRDGEATVITDRPDPEPEPPKPGPPIVINPTPDPEPVQPKPPSPTPAATPYLWVYAKPEGIQNGTDPQSLIDSCKAFQQAGANGILFWDTDPSKPLPWDPYVRKNYDALSAWASDAHFDLALEVCPINETIEAWWGIAGATERGAVGVEELAAAPRSGRALARAGGGEGRRYVCLAEPRVMDVYAQILDNVAALFPKGSPLVAAMPFYDEFRLQGTHPRCHKPGGPLLAAHARKTFDLIRAKLPWARPAAWDDMFNPYSNAKTPYFSVYGGMAGAEAAIDPDVLILNWNTKGDAVDDAFRYFAERGNEQIFCGYYDGAGGDGLSVGDERREIRALQAKYPRLVGWMYTTWQANYSQLRTYLTADGWASPGNVTPPPPQPPDPGPVTPPPPPGPGPVPPPSPDPGPGPSRIVIPYPDVDALRGIGPGRYALGSGDWRTLSFSDLKGEPDNPIIFEAEEPGGVEVTFEFDASCSYVLIGRMR
jgi:hypothetical protein